MIFCTIFFFTAIALAQEGSIAFISGPDLIAVFREIEDEFRSIARQFSDHQ